MQCQRVLRNPFGRSLRQPGIRRARGGKGRQIVMPTKRRVVVTGAGVICASGIGTDKVWERCLAGDNSIGEITRFDTRAYSCKAAGEIQDFRPADYLQPQIIQQTDRSAHLGMAACQLAAEEAGLALKDEDPNQV